MRSGRGGVAFLACLLILLAAAVGAESSIGPHHRHEDSKSHLHAKHSEAHRHPRLRAHGRDTDTRPQDPAWERLKETFIKKPPKLTQPEIRDLVRVLTQKNVPINPKYNQEVRRVLSEAVHNDDWEAAEKALKAHPEYFGKNKVDLPKSLRRKHSHAKELLHARTEKDFDRAFGNKLKAFDRQWRRHDDAPQHDWYSTFHRLSGAKSITES